MILGWWALCLTLGMRRKSDIHSPFLPPPSSLVLGWWAVCLILGMRRKSDVHSPFLPPPSSLVSGWWTLCLTLGMRRKKRLTLSLSPSLFFLGLRLVDSMANTWDEAKKRGPMRNRLAHVKAFMAVAPEGGSTTKSLSLFLLSLGPIKLFL